MHTRQSVPSPSTVAVDSSPAARSKPLSYSGAATVLSLQRLAGNASVTGLLQGRVRGPVPAALRLPVQRACCSTCAQGGVCEEVTDRQGPLPAEDTDIPVQRRVVVQRQQAGSDDCKQLISKKNWTLKGPKNNGGYDTGNYYKDVAAKIIRAAESRGVAFDRALYMAAQARAERARQTRRARATDDSTSR